MPSRESQEAGPLDVTPAMSFILPEMPHLTQFCPHSDAEAVEEASNAWVRARLGPHFAEAGACKTFIDGRHGLWAGYAHPSADVTWVRLLADTFQYWFFLDDAITYDDAGGSDLAAPGAKKRVLTELRQLATGRQPDSISAYGELFVELVDRARLRMSVAQCERLLGYVNVMLDGFADEVPLRAEGHFLDFDSYMDLHLRSIGMDWVYLLVECGIGTDLSADLHSHPEISALHNTLTVRMIYGNDIFGYRRDYFADDPMNGVSALISQHRMSLQEAVDTLHKKIEDSERSFVEARTEILSGALGCRYDIQEYLEELGFLLEGDLRWHYITPRYNGISHQWNGATCGRLTLRPDLTIYHGKRENIAPPCRATPMWRRNGL
jgi:Terpene synthase family 2, C-terminal metal binding